MWSMTRLETKAFWSFARCGGFCFVILCRWKVNPLLIRVALKKLVVELDITVRLQKQRFQPVLFRIFAKVLRIDLPVLFFSGSANAKFEKFSMTIFINIWPSLNFFGFGKSVKSPCHRSSTPLTTVRRRWELRRKRRCKGCRDAQTVSGECVQLSLNPWRCVQVFLKRRDKVRAV